ncbi:ZF-HD transcription factor [Hordeum vulgare]|uniref:ZF-HD dimerization-type domain-containing protein n=1 Tax=Hordeum vulgare subsp. vulgare TaxID=112509 RepID=A0A8I6XA40_HORVV|nr:ZF-HD transcription factor [Hordeum vulgare]
MVSIVQLQRRRTEAAAAEPPARSFLPDREEGERMDLSVPRGEFPIPMHAAAASPYGGGIGGGGVAVADHAMDLHHDHANHNGQSQPQAQDMASPPAAVSEDSSGKKRAAAIAGGGGGGPAVKYRECLKNHAAAIGGNATDGCGEFMPSGEEGSLEALKCSACGCHRNFHRKELDDLDGDSCASHGYGYGHHAVRRLLGPAVSHSHHHKSSGGLLVTADHYGAYAAARALPPPPPPLPGHHHQIIMPLNMIQTSESDEMDGIMGDGRGGLASGGGGGSSSSKKRFRTKFTAEQKGRMLEFAEGVGWRLQKLDDAMVQHFCQEIGVKRRVLKVWMHNNKHNLASRPPPTSPPQPMPVAMSMPMPLGMSMPMQVPPPSQPGPSGHRGPSSPHGELKLD